MKKKRKPSLFEDVVEFPPEPSKEPPIWARWANALALAWLFATRRRLKQPDPAD